MREGISSCGNRLGYDRLEVLERVARGETQPRVAEALGCTERTVRRVLAAAGGAPSRRSRRRSRSPLRLSLVEREEIRAGIAAGDSFRAIARRIGRGPSTVSREVGGVSGRGRCRATRADDRACVRALRPKPAKLASNARLRRVVCEMLERRFSPQQISARLRLQYPDDAEMRIAPETIYQSLSVQSRGPLAQGPGVLPEKRPLAAKAAARAHRPGADQGDGLDLGAPGGGLRPRRAGPLGGRSDRRQGQPLVHRHARRAPNPLSAAELPRQRRQQRDGHREGRRADRAASRAAAAVADL